ncbi:MAG: TonB-dependent receptor [Gemmatimonadales bacterium]
MTARTRSWLMTLLALAIPGVGLAQTGAVAGRVTDSTRGQPLAGAQVKVSDASGRQVGSAVSGRDGSYSVTVPAGRYDVLISLIPFAPRSFAGVTVTAGGTATVDASLVPSTLQLSELVVTTVSRVPEKITEAPADITVIPAVKLQERPSLTVVDHLKEVPGVSISQGGLVQANVVSRGFNNIFSGSLLTLIDNRYASVPSLRVNVPAFFPTVNEDIERVEFVLGPGAALYGPNVSQGVLHIITKSPIDYPGTTLAFEGGLRSRTPGIASGVDDGSKGVARLSFRHATRFSPKVGFKISGEYLGGNDWHYADPGDTLSPPRTPNGSKTSCTSTPFGCRDFDIQKWNGEARIDFRPDQNTEWINSVGRSQAVNLIELTGIGAGQARDWSYTNAQSRFRHKEFFAQGFVNVSNAGETYLLRDGNPIADKSRLWSFQVQHGFQIGSKETIVYGADYIYTDARTGGTINGSNEGDDSIKEFGGYVHSVTNLSEKLDVVAALRVDKNSRLESAVFSPRLAFVLKPSDEHNLRLTYNRAFSTPSNNNLFLDIQAGAIPLGPGIGYTIRALGVPKGGFHFRLNGGCAGGTGDGLCMRSPFAPQLGLLPAQAAGLWSAAVAAVLPTVQQLNPQLAALLQATPAPSAAVVGTQLRTLNPTTGTFIDIDGSQVADIETLKPSIANSFEFGYKFSKSRKASFSFSGYYERRENFVGPLIVETPTVFLDRASTIAYLTQVFGQFLPAQQAQAAAGQVGTAMAGISGGTAAAGTTGVPLATVVPNDGRPLTDRSDIFLTYRNFGTVDVFGADFAFDYFFNDRFSVAATASLVNKDFFTAEEVGGPTDIALNASKTRGSAALRYNDAAAGWGAEGRVRYVKGFPVNSGVYVSPQNSDGSFVPTDSYAVVDLLGTWRPPIGIRNMLLSLSVNNLFNKGYTTFVGVPTLGRLIMSKVSYTF